MSIVSNAELILSQICDIINKWEAHYESRLGLPNEYAIYIIETLVAEYADNYIDVTNLVPIINSFDSEILTNIYKIVLRQAFGNREFNLIFIDIKDQIKSYLLKKFNNRLLVIDGQVIDGQQHSHHYFEFIDNLNNNLLLFTRSFNDGEFQAWVVTEKKQEGDIFNE